MRKRHWIVGIAVASIAVLLLGIALVFPNVGWIFLSPERTLQVFYSQEGAEDMLMDPLILNSGGVRPLVIEAVGDKEMPRRRYAIAFLGNERFREGLAVLRTILEDSSEFDYFRADALESIFRTDSTLGCSLAGQYQSRRDNLGKMANWISHCEPWLFQRRTYVDALGGFHH